jgi:hypothetical protein
MQPSRASLIDRVGAPWLEISIRVMTWRLRPQDRAAIFALRCCIRGDACQLMGLSRLLSRRVSVLIRRCKRNLIQRAGKCRSSGSRGPGPGPGPYGRPAFAGALVLCRHDCGVAPVVAGGYICMLARSRVVKKKGRGKIQMESDEWMHFALEPPSCCDVVESSRPSPSTHHLRLSTICLKIS